MLSQRKGNSQYCPINVSYPLMKNYADHRMHYKMLIAKINEEVDFSGYLQQTGYRLIKSSAGSKEYSRQEERIVVNIKHHPVSYFNRNDTKDKGWFFSYLLQRSVNFYTAISVGLEAIQSSHLSPEPTKIHTPPKKKKDLTDQYAIEPLYKTDYLLDERGLSTKTLASKAFKGRVYNAIYSMHEKNRITNIALPLYDTKGSIKNYTLFNKPYWNKKKNQYEKFRRVLNSEYHYLFTSNPNIEVEGIACFESGFDAMSFNEFKGFPNFFYMAFGGQLDERKLEQFFLWKNKIDPKGRLPITLGFDHDKAGFYFDIYIIKSVVARRKKNRDFKLHRQNSILKLEMSGNGIAKLADVLQIKLNSLHAQIEQDSPVQIISLKTTVIIEMQLERVLHLGYGATGSRWYWKKFIRSLTKSLDNLAIQIEKPPLHKDWNEDLIWFKKHEQIADINTIPSGIKNDLWAVPKTYPKRRNSSIGKVMMLGKDGILCDFGETKYRWISKNEIISFFRKIKPPVLDKKITKSLSHGRKK